MRKENYQIRSEHDPESWKAHYDLVKDFVADQWNQGIGDGVSIEGWGNATSPYASHARTEVGFRSNPRYVNLREFVGLDRNEINALHSAVEVDTSTGSAEYYASHRREGTFRDPFTPSATNVRRIVDGKVVYEHDFKNPRAPELISRLVMKKIVRARSGESPVDY